jgi:hypothetical protein
VTFFVVATGNFSIHSQQYHKTPCRPRGKEKEVSGKGLPGPVTLCRVRADDGFLLFLNKN